VCSVCAESRSCDVLQRMRQATHRESCVLTRHGCVRLQWDFATADDEYPALEVVSATDFVRAEDLKVDWQDLRDRLGVEATPSNTESSPTERRASRYFTNAFYPWTSRELAPGLLLAIAVEWRMCVRRGEGLVRPRGDRQERGG